MVTINFINNKEKEQAIFTAVSYYSNSMQIELNKEAIQKIVKKLADEKFSDAEKSKMKKQQQKLVSENLKLISENKKIKQEVDSTVKAITEAKNEYTSNNEVAIVNLFKLVACGNNKHFFNIVLKDIEKDVVEKLYNLFTSLHVDGAVKEDGSFKQNAENKKTFKEVNDQTQAILKSLFSVPVENEFIKKVNVRFTGTDLRVLHDTFVQKVQSKVRKTKTGTEYDGIEYKFAISKKTNKKGEVSYNSSFFFNQVCHLAFAHICESKAKTQAKPEPKPETKTPIDKIKEFVNKNIDKLEFIAEFEDNSYNVDATTFFEELEVVSERELEKFFNNGNCISYDGSGYIRVVEK